MLSEKDVYVLKITGGVLVSIVFLVGGFFIVDQIKTNGEIQKIHAEATVAAQVFNAKATEEAKKIADEQLREFQRKLDILSCKDRAFDLYSRNWEGECKRLGREEECALPIYLSDRLNQSLEKEKDRCEKK